MHRYVMQGPFLTPAAHSQITQAAHLLIFCLQSHSEGKQIPHHQS